MKIGFDGRVLTRNQITGVERYAHAISQELSRTVPIKIFAPETSGLDGHVWTQTALIFDALESHIDLLHCPSTTVPIFMPARVRVAVTIHDINYLLFPELYSWKFRNYFRLILPLIIARADGVTCQSHYSRRTLIERFPGAAPKSRTIHTAPTKLGERRVLEREPVILCVASLNPNKNIARLLQAFASICHLTPHKLLLVGSRRPSISGAGHFEEALALCPPDRVSSTGFVDDQELCDLYNRADFFVFPSICEGFGVPPLEAMENGCPVLVSNSTSLPEICGEAALYCDPNDTQNIAGQMLELARNTEIKARLRELGEKHAQQFSFAKTASETLAFYRLVASGFSA